MTRPTPPVRDVVFATRFSSCSAAAAIVAAECAASLDARLHVLHVTLPGVGTNAAQH